MTQTVRRPSTPDRAVFGRPASRRPRWWLELTLIAIGYGLYSLVHDVVPEHPSAALAHGRAVERLEHPLFLDWTLPVNRFVAAHEWLAQPMDYYYATLHFIVTPAVLLWLFVGRPRRYRWARNVLVGTTLLALIGFAAFPTAPPRLLPGFGYVDTVIRFHTWGSLADPNIADHANQYAAMPSLHVAWAVWCGVTIFRCAQRPAIRLAGLAYPVATVLVVVGTANHFLLDALAGAAVVALATGAQWLVSAHRARRGQGVPKTRQGP